MHRESNTHGPRKDEALKHELEGMLRGNRPSRAEEWRDPEPPADDDPALGGGDRRGDSESGR
jgi:hypothetical protein